MANVKNERTDKTAKPKQKPKAKEVFWLWQFLSSVKLAVVVIFLIAVACVLGTFIIQGRSSAEYISRFGRGWAGFLEILQFTDVFHSHWFSVLLIMLCLNLLVCAIRRWRNTILQLGFLATHLSLILIMAGSLIDSRVGAKGAINLIEGQTVDHFFTFDEMKEVPLGFELLLEDFELVKHPPKFELIAYVKEKDRERNLLINVGADQSVPSSPYKVKINRIVPDAKLIRDPINTSKELKNPAVFVQLYKSDHVEAEGWLLAKHRNWYELPRGGVRIEYVWVETASELDDLANVRKSAGMPAMKSEDILVASLTDRNLRVELPFKAGEHLNIADSEYHVQIVEYVPDFANKDLPTTDQDPVNPAIRVEIHGPEGNEERWLFGNYPDWDEMHEKKYKNVSLAFEPSSGARIESHLIIAAQDSAGNHRLLCLRDNMVIADSTWQLDEKYSIGESGYQINITKYYPSFGMKEEVIQKSDKLVNPAIYVETSGPAGNVSEWLFAKDARAWWYQDGGLALLYQEEREMIKDFKSTLTVKEDGKVVKTKVIEVNVPLSYKGIDFYQANYDPNNPRFSGIQITSHPGIPIVYSGFILLCVGLVFIFYIKPFIKRHRNKKRKEAAACA